MQKAITKFISRSFTDVISLQDAKDHLRILGTDQDSLVTRYLHAAIQWAETRTERVIAPSVYQIRIEPDDVTLELPLPDFIEITKLESVTDGAKTTLFEKETSGTLSDYITVDDFPNPAEITVSTSNLADTVDYLIITASFGMDTLPEDMKAAIQLLLGHLYRNESEVITGSIATQMPQGAETILSLNTFKRYG
jgi:hypothetical protein